MMDRQERYFLGMDGGGSKTSCALMNTRGKILSTCKSNGISYRQHGLETVLSTVRDLKDECLQLALVKENSLDGICIGLPAYGENTRIDNCLCTRLNSDFPRVLIVNDVHVSWAGSLALGSGINLVSGTGSIAYGVDSAGHSARSGGWSEHIGDEGSSYWLALKGMQLFTKQADHRKPKGPLYRIIKENLRFENDFDFVSIVEEQYLPYRDKTAAFHYLVARAAQENDQEVICLYEQAAEELFNIIQAVLVQLDMKAKETIVSYSGGTFHVGEVLLHPLRKLVESHGMRLMEPMFSPVIGALLLAVQTFAPHKLKQVLNGLHRNRQ